MEKVIKNLEGAILQIKIMDKDIEALRYRSMEHASEIPELRVAIAKQKDELAEQQAELTFIGDKAHNAVLGANDANQKVNAFEERMSPIEETSESHGVRIGKQEVANASLKDEVASLSTETEAQANRLNTLEMDFAPVSGKLVEHSNALIENEGAIANVAATLVEQNATLVELEATVDIHAESIGNLTTTVTENNLSIAQHNGKLVEHSTALAGHSVKHTAHEDKLTAFEAELDTHEGSLLKIKDDVLVLEDMAITFADKDLEIEAAVANVDAAVAATNVAVANVDAELKHTCETLMAHIRILQDKVAALEGHHSVPEIEGATP